MEQWVKGLVLSLQWLRLLLCAGLIPGPGTFTCCGHGQKTKKQAEKKKKVIRHLKELYFFFFPPFSTAPMACGNSWAMD